VEVDVLKLLFPNWVRLVVDLVLTLVLTLPWVTLLIIGGWDSLIYVWDLGERTMTPFEPYLWLFKWVLPAGFFLLWMQILASFTRDLFTLIKGKVVI
jgi:TRAP-type mannitol/chloroaromatic compound transport system permease small subunit